MTAGSSAEENGSHDVTTDKTECKTDEGLDSSKNDSEKTEQTGGENVGKDEEIQKSSDDKIEEADKKNDSGNEEKPEVEDQSMDDPTDEREEAEEKPTFASSRNDKNVVSREDLKAIFQKFGSIKVSHRFFFIELLCSSECFKNIYCSISTLNHAFDVRIALLFSVLICMPILTHLHLHLVLLSFCSLVGMMKYIDFKMGEESGYIRFDEPEAAQKARAAAVLADQGGLAVKNFIATLEPVSGTIQSSTVL